MNGDRAQPSSAPDDDHVVASSVGEVLGSAVARGLDLPGDGLVGPESNVMLLVTDRELRIIRRHPGGRLGDDAWSAQRVGFEWRRVPHEHVIVLFGDRGRVVFRPVDPTDIDRLALVFAANEQTED